MGFLKKTKFLAVCAVSFMALTFAAATCSAKGGGAPEHTQVPKKILFIASFAKSHTWTKNIISGLEQYLDRADYPVDVSVLELGVLRTPDGKPIAGAYEKAMDIIRKKKPDIVAVCDMPAIELFEGHYTDELKDIPVVLCGFPSGIEFSHEKYVARYKIKIGGGKIFRGQPFFCEDKPVAAVKHEFCRLTAPKFRRFCLCERHVEFAAFSADDLCLREPFRATS